MDDPDIFDDDRLRAVIPTGQAGAWSGERQDDAHYQQEAPPVAGAGHWRYELRRWLATLNPGRTGREYEKAVGYFFETPGVPERVDALSFDLLLAYRGALALRATDRQRPQPRRSGLGAHATSRLDEPAATMLPAGEDDGEEAGENGGRSEERDAHGERHAAASASSGPLAPATVNVRLTALRQFLVHCAQVGSLPQLTPDAIRSALRRLRIERRRPYQVLSEPEWEGFLAAALAPAQPPLALPETPRDDPSMTLEDSSTPGASEKSPWGTPRALREPRPASESTSAHDSRPSRDPATRPARTRGGLTGARTAHRDHALIALALATGLRAIELSLLDLGDLTRDWHAGTEEWWLVLPDAKTKGQHGGRTLPLAPALVETLLTYVHQTGRRWERATDRATPLFLSSRKVPTKHTTEHTNETDGLPSAGEGRLTAGQIGRIVDRVEAQWQAERGESTGSVGPGDARRISPHALRHSTAIALLEGNEHRGRPPASVEHVRGWLGHFDIRTTQGYLEHLDARRHRRPFVIDTPTSTPAAGESDADGEPFHQDGGAARPTSGPPDAPQPEDSR